MLVHNHSVIHHDHLQKCILCNNVACKLKIETESESQPLLFSGRNLCKRKSKRIFTRQFQFYNWELEAGEHDGRSHWRLIHRYTARRAQFQAVHALQRPLHPDLSPGASETAETHGRSRRPHAGSRFPEVDIKVARQGKPIWHRSGRAGEKHPANHGTCVTGVSRRIQSRQS